jgi:GTP-binding protein
MAEVLPYFSSRGYRVFPISAVTGEGVKELVTAVSGELERMRQAEKAAEKESGTP